MIKEVVLRFKERNDPWEEQLVQVYDRKDGSLQFEDTIQNTHAYLEVFKFYPNLLTQVWRSDV